MTIIIIFLFLITIGVFVISETGREILWWLVKTAFRVASWLSIVVAIYLIVQLVSYLKYHPEYDDAAVMITCFGVIPIIIGIVLLYKKYK